MARFRKVNRKPATRLMVGFAAAVIATAAATLFRMALTPAIGTAIPFFTYFAATLVVAWYFGFAAAAACILLSVLAGLYFVLGASPFSGTLQPASRVTVVGYMVSSFAASVLLHLQRKTLERVHREVEQRKNAERELAQLQEQLKEELSSMLLLHELGTRLIQAIDLRSALGEILSAAQTVTGADMGNIQLLDSSGALRIEAQCGFSEEFLKFFNTVEEGEATTCGAAFSAVQRIVVEDMERSSLFADTPGLKVMLAAEVRAVQSTPIISRAGRVMGMLSTHYKRPHRPSDRDLRLVDLLARQAGDLVEKLQAEEALRESEERYRATFDNLAVGIAHVGLDGRWMRFNDAVCAITGYSRDELSAKTFADITHPDDIAADWALARSVAAGEIPTYTMEKRYIRKDGSIVWVNLTVSILCDALSEPLHYVSVIEDITARKQAEGALRNSERELRLLNSALARSNADLERFAFAASHDLQEPLRMIASFSQLLVKSYSDHFDERAQTFVEHIVDGTKRMRDLLSDLLTYAKITQRAEEQATCVDMNAVLEDVKANLKPSIDEAGAIIISDQLPTVRAHTVHLASLLQNLVSNAIKYRTEQPPQIRISVKPSNDQWHFAVADNGIGIDPQYHAKIFEVFERLHGRDTPGTGIGLAICKRVVEHHGGRIWVESIPGQGATFCFVLPTVAASATGVQS